MAGFLFDFKTDVEPERLGQPDALAVEIGSHHPASVGFQKLTGQLAEQSQADDDEALAQRRGGPADSLQSNSPKSHGAGRGEVDVVGDRHNQVARWSDQLGVVGTLGAGASHTVTDLEVVDSRTDFDHRSRRRIPGRMPGRQGPLNHTAGVADPLRGRHFDGFHDGLGPSQGPFPEGSPRTLDTAQFGAHGDARMVDPDQNRAGFDDWIGHVFDDDCALPDEYLFHSLAPTTKTAVCRCPMPLAGSFPCGPLPLATRRRSAPPHVRPSAREFAPSELARRERHRPLG